MLGLTLGGMALVALPLLVAIANAAVKLGQLAAESEAVAAESSTSSVESQRISGLVTNLERYARQYLILYRDEKTRAQAEETLRLFEADRDALSMSINVLAALPQAPDVALQLERVPQVVEATFAALRADFELDPVSEIVDDNFRFMRGAVSEISQGMRVARNAALASLQESTRDAQQALLWQSALLIPGTAVLIMFFLVLVGRPMRQVDRAIRELGSGDFSRAITVRGPRDIETLGRQLEWLRHRLRESTEEKNKFLRHMSHELKTPLANIREGTELLLDGAVGPLDMQQQEVTVILRDNGVKLQSLIENLLNFSAWQTKTASLEIAEFDLKPLVFRVLSQHRLLISNQKIKLQLNVDAVRVSADEGKLRLVLENLVSNAIKFLPNGGTIHIGAEVHGGALVLDVADTGPGVASEDRERIFEAFYQGRRLQGGPLCGTGIGLSVVAECVQAHGGSVELVNSHWPGAHFQVKLPLRRAADRPQLVVNNG
jgi:two-component system, NtrC family, sensor histidine kinase GlrK